MARVAIVGGSGFVGSNLAERFGKHYDVRIVDARKPSSNLSSFEFYECDIRRIEQVEAALEGIDLVLHTAIVQIPQINTEIRLGYEVNVLGTQNLCEMVRRSSSVKGMIATGTWHTIGERNIRGIVDETFGFRPDMVEDRARLYALSKICQESIVRFFDEESNEKVYALIRIGTALGENMPKKTAANIFIDQALRGEDLTPYDNSMYRPMLYVDVRDVEAAFEVFSQKILEGRTTKSRGSLSDIVNVYYPEPMTILELAESTKAIVSKLTEGRIVPNVKIVESGKPSPFTPQDKSLMKVDVARVSELLGLEKLTSPYEVLQRVIRSRLSKN